LIFYYEEEKMNKVRICGFLTIILFIIPSQSKAIVNGSFENGLSGWNAESSLGGVGVSSGGTDGTHHASLMTSIPYGPGSGFAHISQSFSANTGDILHFDYTFSKNEDMGGHASGTVQIGSYSYYFNPIYSFTDFSYTIPQTGDYTISLDATAQFPYFEMGNTGAYIDVDNVRIVSVPEPGSIMLLVIGAITALFWRHRRIG
jgi:hypothetical protein